MPIVHLIEYKILDYIYNLPSSITELDIGSIRGIFDLSKLPNLKTLYTSCDTFVEFITNKPLSHEITIKFMVCNSKESHPIFTEDVDENDILHHNNYKYKTIIINENVKKAKFQNFTIDIHNITDDTMYCGSYHFNYFIPTIKYW